METKTMNRAYKAAKCDEVTKSLAASIHAVYDRAARECWPHSRIMEQLALLDRVGYGQPIPLSARGQRHPLQTALVESGLHLRSGWQATKHRIGRVPSSFPAVCQRTLCWYWLPTLTAATYQSFSNPHSQLTLPTKEPTMRIEIINHGVMYSDYFQGLRSSLHRLHPCSNRHR